MGTNPNETHPVREGKGPDSRNMEPGIIFMIILFSLFGFFILAPVALFIYKNGILATGEKIRQLSQCIYRRGSKDRIADEERPPPYIPPADVDVVELMRPRVRPSQQPAQEAPDDGFEEVDLSAATTENMSIRTEGTAPPPYTSRPPSIREFLN